MHRRGQEVSPGFLLLWLMYIVVLLLRLWVCSADASELTSVTSASLGRQGALSGALAGAPEVSSAQVAGASQTRRTGTPGVAVTCNLQVCEYEQESSMVCVHQLLPCGGHTRTGDRAADGGQAGAGAAWKRPLAWRSLQ